jgi:NADH-quinone oxidoreductase subunit N
VGFYAKLSVLQALIASGQTLDISIAIFAVLMSLVGAFYYLRLVKVMYFDAPISATTVVAPLDVRVVLCINGALVLCLGLFPNGLMDLGARAVQVMLGTNVT